MNNVEEFGAIISNALDSYKSDFMELVREYAISCKNQGEAYCDFFCRHRLYDEWRMAFNRSM